MRDSSKAALGGIIAALSIVIMLITYISPFLVYTAPPFAGLLLIVIVYEMGYGWAFGTYAAVSLLSAFMIADKEAALFYVLFFGYYPALRELFSSKILHKTVRLLISFLIFNSACACAILLGEMLFAVDYSELMSGGKVYFLIFWLGLNAVFFCYEFLISRLVVLYRNKLRKKIRNLFRT